MNSREKTISLESLTIGYKMLKGYKCVSQNINASVYCGELTCLLGANGIGKSTLLRTMTANQPILAGEIYYQGRSLSTYSSKELSTIISIVLTDRITVKNLRVFDLVGMGRSPYTGFWGTVSQADRVIVQESLRLVGVEHLAKRMVHTLSDGERQKVMIAKALAQQTPIILLDEPTAFLDFPSKVDMMQLLHRLSRKTQKTIFLSTHDLDLALQVADCIWLMDNSNGITVGTPEDLALEGDLCNFFERKGIAFDPNTGLFRVDNESSSVIEMSGDSFRHSMIRKALMRNGISVGENLPDAKYSISVEGGDIKISVKNSVEFFVVKRIKELLNIVMK
ncbi:MAG: ABC transporter ATP-binding protein [Rikenellaceae bacterium]